MLQKYHQEGTSLVIHWLRLRTSTPGGMGSIPSHRNKILHPTYCTWFSQKKKKNLKSERQPTEWEKIFASHISDMELVSRIY